MGLYGGVCVCGRGRATRVEEDDSRPGTFSLRVRGSSALGEGEALAEKDSASERPSASVCVMGDFNAGLRIRLQENQGEALDGRRDGCVRSDSRKQTSKKTLLEARGWLWRQGETARPVFPGCCFFVKVLRVSVYLRHGPSSHFQVHAAREPRATQAKTASRRKTKSREGGVRPGLQTGVASPNLREGKKTFRFAGQTRDPCFLRRENGVPLSRGFGLAVQIHGAIQPHLHFRPESESDGEETLPLEDRPAPSARRALPASLPVRARESSFANFALDGEREQVRRSFAASTCRRRRAFRSFALQLRGQVRRGSKLFLQGEKTALCWLC